VGRRPAGGGADLTLSLRTDGLLAARRATSGLVFVDRAGRVVLRLGGLAALDARGRRLPASLGLGRGRVLIRVDVRRAAFPVRIDPFIQQGAKLIGDCAAGCGGPSGSGESGAGELGDSVAVSADGSTALVGASQDDNNAGGAWVFTRVNGAWSQEGGKIVPTGATGTAARFGWSVALSSDGTTAAVGAPGTSAEPAQPGSSHFWPGRGTNRGASCARSAAARARMGLSSSSAPASLNGAIVAIQVKAANADATANLPWPVGTKAIEPPRGDNEWYAFVALTEEGGPKTWIVPRAHVAAIAWAGWKDWRYDPAYDGKRHSGLEHTRVGPGSLSRYEERWDLLASRHIPGSRPSYRARLGEDRQMGSSRRPSGAGAAAVATIAQSGMSAGAPISRSSGHENDSCEGSVRVRAYGPAIGIGAFWENAKGRP
jgi:hypothetical protein